MNNWPRHTITASFSAPLLSSYATTVILSHDNCLEHYKSFPVNCLVIITVIFGYVTLWFFCPSRWRFFFSMKQSKRSLIHASSFSVDIIVINNKAAILPFWLIAHELSQHLFCDIILKQCRRLSLRSRKSLHSCLPSLRREPLFLQYHVLLTATYLKLWKRHIHTCTSPWPIKFFNAVHHFRKLLLGLCKSPGFSFTSTVVDLEAHDTSFWYWCCSSKKSRAVIFLELPVSYNEWPMSDSGWK